MSDPASAIRALMRRAPQLVTVVTASGPAGPRGITVSSFISVSLEPPLVLVSIMHSARAHAAIAAGAFRVHLLASDQAGVSGHFAKPGIDADAQFSGAFAGALEAGGPGRPPLLSGCIGWLHCTTVGSYSEGDHTLFVGRVTEGRVERTDAVPLLYYDRGYREVGAVPDESRR
jgi:flavin reductase (DIM6/NTAB) family NADH-FMN oxidoreductase RutF